MKVNKPLVVSILIILACRAINHFVWVEYAKPLVFSYQAEVLPEALTDGNIGGFRKTLNQFTKDYCAHLSYLPWVNCQDTHITKGNGIKELWDLNDDLEVVLSFFEVIALGFLVYNQRAWISLDIFLFQMNGLFYGSFPSFLSTFLSLLQEILKNLVDFPVKDSLAVIRVWEPRVLPLLLLIPVWPQINAYYKGQSATTTLVSSSVTSVLNTVLPLLGIGIHALSFQLFETKTIGMALTAALILGYYFLIPKMEVKLQPYIKKIESLSLGGEKTATPADKSKNPVGSPKPSRNNTPVPNGSSGGAANGKK